MRHHCPPLRHVQEWLDQPQDAINGSMWAVTEGNLRDSRDMNFLSVFKEGTGTHLEFDAMAMSKASLMAVHRLMRFDSAGGPSLASSVASSTAHVRSSISRALYRVGRRLGDSGDVHQSSAVALGLTSGGQVAASA